MARESQGWLWTNLWLFWSLLQVYHFYGSPTPKSASLIHFYLPQHNCYASAFIVIDIIVPKEFQLYHVCSWQLPRYGYISISFSIVSMCAFSQVEFSASLQLLRPLSISVLIIHFVQGLLTGLVLVSLSLPTSSFSSHYVCYYWSTDFLIVMSFYIIKFILFYSILIWNLILSGFTLRLTRIISYFLTQYYCVSAAISLLRFIRSKIIYMHE